MIKEQLDKDISDTATVESSILLPAILVRNGRHQFRKAFIRIYPFFLYTLRNAVPEITDGEEMLCMLIHLKQNTNDIAAILGIARKSVNQARYRLRQKINISEQLTLEEFVQRLSNY